MYYLDIVKYLAIKTISNYLTFVAYHVAVSSLKQAFIF